MTKLSNQQTINTIAEHLSAIGASFTALSELFPHLDFSAPVASEAKALVEAVEKQVTKAKPKAPAAVEPEIEEDAIEEDGEEEVDLEAMTVKELKAFAAEYDIDLPAGKPTKAAIIEAIEAGMEDGDDSEEEEVEEDVAEEEEAADDEEVDLEAMDKDELLSFIEENFEGEEAPKKKKVEKVSAYESRLRTFIEELLADVEEDAAEEVETEEADLDTVIETEDGEVDLAEMTVKQLKAFADEYELEVEGKTKSVLIEEILEQLTGDEEEETETEEDDADEEALADEYGLNDMEIEDLAELLEEHGLSTKGKKQALIDRVLKAIEDGTIEIEEEDEGE